MKGVGHALGGPPGALRSISLNVPYHKNKNIYGLGRVF